MELIFGSNALYIHTCCTLAISDACNHHMGKSSDIHVQKPRVEITSFSEPAREENVDFV